MNIQKIKNQIDNETLLALIESIQKWGSILNGTGKDWGSQNCPLCKLFSSDKLCKNCPISKSSENYNRHDCKYTPYVQWYEHQQGHRYPSKNIRYNNSTIYSYPFYIYNGCNECRNLAIKEMNFLNKFLPVQNTLF